MIRFSHMCGILPLLVLGLAPSLSAIQPPRASQAQIQTHSLLQRTATLSSDAFEGRAPASVGEQKTIEFLIQEFTRMGLEPGMPDGSWTQDVPIAGVTATIQTQLTDTATGTSEPLQFPQDIVAWSPTVDAAVELPDTDMIFVGYGITAPEYDWDDYKDVDVRGKTVVILINDPPIVDRDDPTQLDADVFKGIAMTYYGRWTYKYEEAARRGASAAIIIHETAPAAYPWFVVINSWGREQFRLPDSGEPALTFAAWISLQRAESLFEANNTTYTDQKREALSRDFKPRPLRHKIRFEGRQTIRNVLSRNVVAKRTGRDSRLQSENVVYTAHWDHLGIDPRLEGDQIYNGALDNAIGTAGLLELAGAFSDANRSPRRTVYFIALTAEEQGLLGAQYYVQNPVTPLANTVANINMDGLNPWGRTRDVRLIGDGNSSLDTVTRSAVRRQKRIVLPDPAPEKGSFYRSDHFEFMKRGVPALYLRAGMEFVGKPSEFGDSKLQDFVANHYHKVSDEMKSDWDLAGAVEDLKLLFDIGWRVAEDRNRPTWLPNSEFKAPGDALQSSTRLSEDKRVVK